MNKEEVLKKFRGYWYYAGEWHNAECPFILHDEGVCNCDIKKNRGILELQQRMGLKES